MKTLDLYVMMLANLSHQNRAIRSLCSVDGIGSKVALQVRDGLAKRRAILLDLNGLLNIKPEPKAASGGFFEGMTFCLTGTLKRPRKEVQQSIKAAGESREATFLQI